MTNQIEITIRRNSNTNGILLWFFLGISNTKHISLMNDWMWLKHMFVEKRHVNLVKDFFSINESTSCQFYHNIDWSTLYNNENMKMLLKSWQKNQSIVIQLDQFLKVYQDKNVNQVLQMTMIAVVLYIVYHIELINTWLNQLYSHLTYPILLI